MTRLVRIQPVPVGFPHNRYVPVPFLEAERVADSPNFEFLVVRTLEGDLAPFDLDAARRPAPFLTVAWCDRIGTGLLGRSCDLDIVFEPPPAG